MLVSIVLWIIFGAIVGFIADMLDSSVVLSWPEKILVGIVGAVVGGTIAHVLTTGSLDLASAASFDLVSIVISVIGALISVFVWKRVRGKSLTA